MRMTQGDAEGGGSRWDNAMISFGMSFAMIALASVIAAGLLVVGVFPRRRWILIVGGLLGIGLSLYVASQEVLGYGRLPSWVLGACVAGLPSSIWLIRKGVRGKQVGDHTFCRSCGFDLFGRPETTTLCGECGLDITLPRSTVIGVRKRKLPPIFAGLFLLILSASVGAPWAVREVQQIQWREYQPESWLLSGLARGDVLDAQIVRTRFVSNKLSKPATSAAIRLLLQSPAAAGSRPGMVLSWALHYWESLDDVDQQFVLGKVREQTAPIVPDQIAAERSFMIAFPTLASYAATKTVEADNVRVSVAGTGLPSSNDPIVQSRAIVRDGEIRLCFSTHGMDFTPGKTVTIRLQYTETIRIFALNSSEPEIIVREIDTTFGAQVVDAQVLDCQLNTDDPVSPAPAPSVQLENLWGGEQIILGRPAMPRLDRVTLINKEGQRFEVGAVYFGTGEGYLQHSLKLDDQMPLEVVLTPAPELGYQLGAQPRIDSREVRIGRDAILDNRTNSTK